MRVVLPIGLSQDSVAPYREALEAVGLIVRVVSSSDFTVKHESVAGALLDDTHGLLLAGGGDIDPLLIGTSDASHPTVYGVDVNRDRLERALFTVAWRRHLPILAICRGMQVMNWALGGTLYADIDDCFSPQGVAKGHRQTDQGLPRTARTHSITVKRETLLHDILRTDVLVVNSIHHQGVRRIADPLVVNAVASDAIVEGMEAPGRDFALAVQFHPEELWRDEPLFSRLFERFARAVSGDGRGLASRESRIP